MKNDELYTYYMKHLHERLAEGKLSRGTFSLLSISKNSFDEFKYKFENDITFAVVLKRDKKIDDIISDEEN